MIKGLRAHLVAEIGNTKVYPDHKVPANAVSPYVTYTIVNTEHERHLRGAGVLTTVTVEIRVHASTREAAHAVEQTVYLAIGEHGYSGTWDGKPIAVAYWAGEDWSPDPGEGWYEATLDLIVNYYP